LKRLLFVISEDYVFVSHRLFLGKYALEQGMHVGILCNTSKHKKLIEESGIEVFDWPFIRGSLNPINEIKSLWFVFITIKKFKPDIVHSVALKPIIYASIACRCLFIKRRVFALTGVGFVFSSDKMKAKFLRPAVAAVLKWAFNGSLSRIIVQNSDDRVLLASKNIADPESVHLIRGAGVDTVAFKPSFIDSNIPLVILPARVLWDKGVGEFVSAARILYEKGLNARFAIVGEPDHHNPMCVPIAQIKLWVNEGTVEYWGHQYNMPKVLESASIVCLPSYREGLPKSLLEAASCGLPLVAFDVPGCREAIDNERNGYLVPLKDVNALSMALEKLILNKDLRETMGNNSRKKAIQEFSQERIAKETFEVWESLFTKAVLG